jgi:hypothetical protein
MIGLSRQAQRRLKREPLSQRPKGRAPTANRLQPMTAHWTPAAP